MKTILDRLQAMERLLPSYVTVTFPDGRQTVVGTAKAVEIAITDDTAKFSIPDNTALENLLQAVADTV